MWGCFLMSGVKILHFLKDWWKSIPIHQNYTMALNLPLMLFHVEWGDEVKGHIPDQFSPNTMQISQWWI